MPFIGHNLRRLKYALQGVVHAVRHDRSYRLQFYGGALLLSIFSFFYWPLSKTELLFLLLAWFLVLITELQNSAFEEALDHLHPELHDRIGKSKDMAAGAVLTAGIFLGIVLLSIVF